MDHPEVEALVKYRDLNALAMQVVRAGGVFVTCSCSGLVSREVFKATVFRAARRAKVMLQIFSETGAGPDHPVLMNCPESEYLKVIWSRVM